MAQNPYDPPKEGTGGRPDNSGELSTGTILLYSLLILAAFVLAIVIFIARSFWGSFVI